MSKETEELIFVGIGAYFLLSLLKGGTTNALAAQRLAAGNNAVYANDATSVLNTAINDFSD